jgi:hypothetical protein
MLMKADGSAGRERKKRRLAPQRGADAIMREETGDGDDDGAAAAHTRD